MRQLREVSTRRTQERHLDIGSRTQGSQQVSDVALSPAGRGGGCRCEQKLHRVISLSSSVLSR